MSFTWTHLFQPSLLGSGNFWCRITRSGWPKCTLHLGENGHLSYCHFKLAWPVRAHTAGLCWRAPTFKFSMREMQQQQQSDVPRREYERHYLISLPILPVNFILFCIIYQCGSSEKRLHDKRDECICCCLLILASTATELCSNGHDWEMWCNHQGLGIIDCDTII